MVTWFAGLFYIVRLFIYNREAADKPSAEREILQNQFIIMIKRLWFGITWPSSILTLFFGTWMLVLYGSLPGWLIFKLSFVFCLFLYHLSIHIVYKQQAKGIFNYSSNQLRVWNEVATIFLISIVMLVEVKSALSLIWGLGGLVAFSILLMLAIRFYRKLRLRDKK